VFCATAPKASYERVDTRFPELPPWAEATTAVVAVRKLLAAAGLDRARLGSREWNPMSAVIRDGANVVIKPNWVSHHNGSGHGLECVVTHPSVIEAILHYVAKANPRSIILGDAPVQGCDFSVLAAACGLNQLKERFGSHGVDVTISDFRRTIRSSASLASQALTDCRPLDRFVFFDLGTDSALEPITTGGSEFRVTMYNPDLMRRTHGPGRHQYLVAREVMDADVVINVPKLKTHKKVGVTAALKNVVGINGHKEYLPHHRKGGSAAGGDCYEGRSWFKQRLEDLLDTTNRTEGPLARPLLANALRAGMLLGRVAQIDNNYEGSWHGNDTAWRMTLDLQRVLHYGRLDGTLSEQGQRTILTVTDALIAGEAEGPLSPEPRALGLLTLSSNPAGADWVHALLMGLNPVRIPLIREAFSPHRYPLASFDARDIIVNVNEEIVPLDDLFARYGSPFRPPRGWTGHCELDGRPRPGPRLGSVPTTSDDAA
jgi:uncharacterized protein (DUF362 family)